MCSFQFSQLAAYSQYQTTGTAGFVVNRLLPDTIKGPFANVLQNLSLLHLFLVPLLPQLSQLSCAWSEESAI